MPDRSSEIKMFYGASPAIFDRAKELRKHMTPTERILWSKISNKKLGVKFRRQHPIKNYIVDFYCHTSKIVIEIDGKIHDYQKEYDSGRQAEIEQFGIKVLRFTNQEIYEDIPSVINKIKEAI